MVLAISYVERLMRSRLMPGDIFSLYPIIYLRLPKRKSNFSRKKIELYRISRLRKLHSDLESYIKDILLLIIITARAYKSVTKKTGVL